MDLEKAVITVGREYGSGGHDIGKLVAEMLHVPFYDKEIITQAARDSGICEELFQTHDEKTVPSYLFGLMTNVGELPPLGGSTELPLNHRIFMAQFEAIQRLALQGPCVVVGRCGNYVLKGQPNVVNVFIYGDTEARIQRIMRVENIPYSQAKDHVRKVVEVVPGQEGIIENRGIHPLTGFFQFSPQLRSGEIFRTQVPIAQRVDNIISVLV